MGIEKVVYNITDTFSRVIQETPKKTVTGTIQNGDKKIASALDALASQGAAFLKKSLSGKYSLDTDLPVINRKIADLSEMGEDNIIMTHLTHYMPQKGIIKTSLDAGGINRNTLHFAFNHSVVNPLGGGGKVGWTDCEYSVLVPFKKAVSQSGSLPYGGRHNDFIFVGNMQLPEGSFIVRQNKNLEDGVVEFFDAATKLDGYNATNGITLVETNMTPYEATDVLIEKLGYTNFKKMHAEGIGQSVEAFNMFNDVENFSKKSDMLIEELENLSEADFEALIEKNAQYESDWNNSWANFCKKFNYENCIDKDTIFSKNTGITEIIGCLDEINADWVHKGVDYKEPILSTLKTLMEDQNSSMLPFKPEAMYEIISSAKTPKEASEKLYSLMGLRTKIDKATNMGSTIIEKELERTLQQLLSKPDGVWINL